VRDVIQKIVATEAEAKSAVEEARAQADRILSEARRKARDIAAQANVEANTEAECIVAAAVEAADKEKEERLVRAAAKIDKQVGIDEAGRRRVVEKVVRCICKP